MNIEGNVALITGGTSGLGLALARQLLDAGAQVVLSGRDAERGAKAVAELGRDVVFVPGDIAREEDVAAAVSEAAGRGRLGIAVNCAGSPRVGRVLSRRGPLPAAEFAHVMGVNLLGTFNVVRLAAEAMAGNEPQDGDRGVIVCTASIAAFDGMAGQVAYAASKAGVTGMTLPLARDLARHAIRVVTVAPGLFDTPMLAGMQDEMHASLLERTPHPQRLGKPSEFAALVAHVVQNPMLNGEVIRLDAALRLGVV